MKSLGIRCSWPGKYRLNSSEGGGQHDPQRRPQLPTSAAGGGAGTQLCKRQVSESECGQRGEWQRAQQLAEGQSHEHPRDRPVGREAGTDRHIRPRQHAFVDQYVAQAEATLDGEGQRRLHGEGADCAAAGADLRQHRHQGGHAARSRAKQAGHQRGGRKLGVCRSVMTSAGLSTHGEMPPRPVPRPPPATPLASGPQDAAPHRPAPGPSGPPARR